LEWVGFEVRRRIECITSRGATIVTEATSHHMSEDKGENTSQTAINNNLI